MTSHDAAAVTAAVHAVETVLAASGADARRVSTTEWGFTLEVGGWPLHVGVAVRGTLLGARAEAVGPGRLDPAVLLHRNRLGALVRYATTAAGAVWVQGEIPVAGVHADGLDELLARLVESATWAREAAAPGAGDQAAADPSPPH